MKNKILWLALLLFPMLLGSCSKNEDIVFDHERQMFEIQEGKILLEVILPSSTTAGEEIYISGAFNGGDEAAVGNEAYKLIRTEATSIKRAVYLDPSTFVDGKTLADGFHFVSDKQRQEVDVKGQDKWHYENPGAGTSTNITVDRWAAYYDKPDEGGEDDGPYVPYLDDANEVSIFFETPTEGTYNVWVWGDLGCGEAYTATGAWPGDEMTLMGQGSNGNYIYKYTITVTDQVPSNLIITRFVDGAEAARPYDGVAFVNHGYYVEGNDTPTEEITQVGPPAGNEFKPTLDDPNEVSVFLETPTEGTYNVWVWGDLGGGEAYTAAGAWPGDEMTQVGKTSDGNFVYKYTITVTDQTPSNLIITRYVDGAEAARLYDGVAFVNHGYYVEGNDTPTKEITDVK
jgi:hypothetical protein